jgi:Probable transposase.
MEETYQIHENFLYLENKIFRGMDQIKQLRIYPPEKGSCKIIVVYEVPDQEELPQNGHELSIDLGLHNLMTCYDSENGKTFILGRKYLDWKDISIKRSQGCRPSGMDSSPERE